MATAEQYRQLAWRIATEEFGDSPLRDIFYRQLRQESADFSPDVVEGRRRSSAGAIGIAQFMAQTAANLGVNPLDPAQAVRGAARYMRENLQTFGGDVAKAVAAYNAGPGTVQRAVQQGGADWIAALPGETQSYLRITMPQGGVEAGIPNVVQTTPYAGGQAPQATATVSPYAFPVQGYQGDVALHWGEDRGASDIFAPAGTPVVAMTGGTVVSAGFSEIGGNNVTIQGDDGNVYYMAHLVDTPTVQAGQRVEQGTVLGGVGDTGNAKGKGAQLHIGIGPSIISGTGPTGGSGANFDAVGLLQQTLGGTASYTPGQGGAGVATPAGTAPSGFYGEQLAQAQQEYQKLAAEEATLRAKPTRTPEEQARLEEIAGDGIVTAGLKGDALARIQAFQKLATDTAPSATGSDPATAAATAGGLRQNTFTNAMDVWTGLLNAMNIDATIKNELSTILMNALQANNSATDNWVKNELARGNLTLDQAVSVVQAQAMRETAQAARNAEELARAQFIDEATSRNFERRLPPGVTEVPGLGKNDALASATRNFGLEPTTLGVVPVDWEELRPERSLERAGATFPDVGQFDIQGIQNVAGQIAAIQNPAPKEITPSNINLQGPPNIGALMGNVPQQPNYDDLIARILAPPPAPVPPQSTVAAVTPAQAPTPDPNNPTNAPLGPSATGFIAAEAAATPDSRPSVAQTDRLLNPGQAITETATGPTVADRIVDPAAALRGETPNYGPQPPAAHAGEQDPLSAWLRRYGLGVATGMEPLSQRRFIK